VTALVAGFPADATMEAVPPTPEKRATVDAKPPGGMAVAALFTPPPKPQVWIVRAEGAESTKLCAKTEVGMARLPVKDSEVT